jgi:hypothetical protein
MASIGTALGGPFPAEVEFSATVTSAPHFFMGTTTHARHEAFEVQTDDGHALEIVDNVDLAPTLPVGVGDRIAVHGELVDDPGRGPVVHYTHHDPSGRHEGGWIDFNGKRYA